MEKELSESIKSEYFIGLSNNEILKLFELKGGYLGNGVPIGGGEVAYPMYYNGGQVGKVIMTNGTQRNEDAGIITGISLDNNWENAEGGYEAACSKCGEIYFSCDDQYKNEYPNSASMAESEAAEKHDNICGLDDTMLGKALDRTVKYEGWLGSIIIGLENGELDWDEQQEWANGLASLTKDFTEELLPDYIVIPKQYDDKFLLELEKSGDLIGYTINDYPVVLKGVIKKHKMKKVTTQDLNEKGLLNDIPKRV